jgi:hypothetical protein
MSNDATIFASVQARHDRRPAARAPQTRPARVTAFRDLVLEMLRQKPHALAPEGG